MAFHRRSGNGARLFYKQQATLAGGANWSSVQTAQKQRNDLTDYANTLSLGGSCSNTTIQAQDISISYPENGSAVYSNQFASNDFYQYTHSGGDLTINLSYTAASSSNPADLDLYLYDSDYTFGDCTDAVASSLNRISVGETSGSESISLGNLAAGTYMINVNVYTKNRLGTSAAYSLTINSQAACPD